MILEARDLTVRFGAQAALDGVNCALHPGELLAIVGPNGSGKSTLLRALLGLVAPDVGQVRCDGRAVGSWSRRALAETIGALPQHEESAFPLTVRETMLLGRWARLGPVAPIGADDEIAIAAALARCDVTGFDHRGVDTLSSGERQRVRVARALAGSPRLLLLDEPTAALDIGHEMELFELFRALAHDGLGVLVVTHDLNLAARYADRALLLDHGQVAAAGTPTEVFVADILTHVFAWPVSVTAGLDGRPHVIPLRRDQLPT